jgi:hypothetical protein
MGITFRPVWVLAPAFGSGASRRSFPFSHPIGQVRRTERARESLKDEPCLGLRQLVASMLWSAARLWRADLQRVDFRVHVAIEPFVLQHKGSTGGAACRVASFMNPKHRSLFILTVNENVLAFKRCAPLPRSRISSLPSRKRCELFGGPDI